MIDPLRANDPSVSWTRAPAAGEGAPAPQAPSSATSPADDHVDAPGQSRARDLARSLQASSDAGSADRLAAARAHLASGFFQSAAGMDAIAEGMTRG
jgi:hypothetical protein